MIPLTSLGKAIATSATGLVAGIEMKALDAALAHRGSTGFQFLRMAVRLHACMAHACVPCMCR